MKRLSDYKGEDAIDLWADLLDPIIVIMSDPNVAKAYRSESKVAMAKQILKDHKAQATEILTRIDPTPLDGLNLIMRVLDVILEIENSEEFASFFGSSVPESEEAEPSGAVTESTEVKGK